MGREPKKRGGHLLRLLLEGKMELADLANRKMRINVKKEIWEGLKRKSE